MGYAVTQQDNDVAYNVKKFIIDTEADLASISPNNLAPGSEVLCLKPVKGYVLNTQLIWEEVF